MPINTHYITPAEGDPAWDEFLATQPAGHYTQSCPWGMLKAKFGWEVNRILIKEGDQILGGAQLLLRRLPFWGKVGYISKGPVIKAEHPEVMEKLLGDIEAHAKKNAILLISIQPPADQPEYTQPIIAHQYEPSSYYIVPPSTVLIDLSQSEDEILRKMKRTTRQNIRAAKSRGVTVKEGIEADLPAFCQLKQITESRSEFIHYDQDYYQEAWRQFAPRGAMKLWLAYFGDELLAGLMAIYFGYWVVYAWAGSTRSHVEKRPNDLLFWHAMMWGKQQGYRYCDLGGISPIVADALRQNIEPPECKEKGIARYKLGFGPMHTFPSSYDNIFILRPRWLFRKAISVAWNSNRKGLSRFVRGVSS
jgi:peptidoglycan pentaglycine glycine transferase (the first glycine)